MDMRLELVPLPTSDVDRSKTFYAEHGFRSSTTTSSRQRHARRAADTSWVEHSIVIGRMSAPDAPRVQNLHLVVDDIEHPRDAVARRRRRVPPSRTWAASSTRT